LFSRLLRTLDIETVCDVGSMDGLDALRFRRMLPRAAILALEPNPQNFALMAADERLRRSNIRVLPAAASDRRGEAPFYVVDADDTGAVGCARRGMSSLHRRQDGSALAAVIHVPTVRLDQLLESESLAATPIALWIDTEGSALQTIQGGAGILPSTRMIHVEVETRPVMGADHRLFADVDDTLRDAGFVLFATDQAREALQFNALYLRADVVRAKGDEILRRAERERLRRHFSRSILRLMPRRLRLALGFRIPDACARD
jgi:FkbM family methyltransferase